MARRKTLYTAFLGVVVMCLGVPASAAAAPVTPAIALAVPSAAQVGQTVTFQAVVAGDAGSPPTGTVDFKDNDVSIGCAPGSQPLTPVGASSTTSVATCVVTVTPGSHSIAAAYTGDSAYSSATSDRQSFTAAPATTSLTMSSSPPSPTVGQTVTYTATIAPGTAGGAFPTGTVAFYDAGSLIAGCSSRPVSSSAAAAACPVRYTAAHSHTITASYGGDSNFSSSNSLPLMITVASKPPGAASARTGRASHLSTSDATLTGTVVSGGQAVEYQFQYGTSEPFTHATPLMSIPAGHGSVSVSRRLRGLKPGITYRYELVVIPATDSPSFGNVLSLTTKPIGKVKLPFTTLTVTGKTVSAAIGCRSKLTCKGRLALVTKPKSATATPFACAGGAYTVASNQQSTFAFKLSHACLAQLSRSHKKLVVTVTATPSTGQLPIRRTIRLVLG